MRSPPPSRRQLLSGLAVAAVEAACNPPAPALISESPPLAAMLKPLPGLRDDMKRELLTRLTANGLARNDGYTYTVDIAQLMICLAQLGDQATLAPLLQHSRDHLIRNEPSDPFTRGFVGWRYHPNLGLDATGTTESLRLAKAFWLAASAFANPSDADIARMILDGYAKHANVDEGIWLIRNYYDFSSRCFASNSFLVDYDPDFIREVADADRSPSLGALADHSLAAVRSAAAPSGLLYDLIQPELKTLYPLLNLEVFSPNDVIGIANAATTAFSVARQAPALARGLLRFVLAQPTELQCYYLGRNGRPVADAPAKAGEYAILLRLAAAVGDDTAVSTLLAIALPQWRWIADHITDPVVSPTFLLTEILAATIQLLRPP